MTGKYPGGISGNIKVSDLVRLSEKTIITLITSGGIIITKRGQHKYLSETMLGVTPPKLVVMSLAHSAPILTNTHILTFGGATVTKCRLQVLLLETTSCWVLVTS